MAGGWMASVNAKAGMMNRENGKFPREVWIGTISQERMEVDDREDLMAQMLGFLEEMSVTQPDIVCLPETFTRYGSEAGSSFGDSAETLPYPSLIPFQEFAREKHCCLICPIIIRENGKAYNAAVVLDRHGNILGNYKKMHPTIGEMEEGVVPGPPNPPVFDLDFGRIGIQICFDIQWQDGWESLAEQHPDIIFWPSAFPGRTLIQTKAWECGTHTVSSTIKGPARICDLSGRVMARTEYWNRNWICAPVNLEQVLIHTWPYVRHFPDMKEKYGRHLKIETFDEEEWTILESLSSELSIRDVMDEFGILSLREHVGRADGVQKKHQL